MREIRTPEMKELFATFDSRRRASIGGMGIGEMGYRAPIAHSAPMNVASATGNVSNYLNSSDSVAQQINGSIIASAQQNGYTGSDTAHTANSNAAVVPQTSGSSTYGGGVSNVQVPQVVLPASGVNSQTISNSNRHSHSTEDNISTHNNSNDASGGCMEVGE